MASSIVLTNAVWIDVNPNYTQNNLPDRIPDTQAVMFSGLLNLFNCPVGARGRTFQPEYGSFWYKYLQEPITPITARSMTIGMFQAIRRWEPRIVIDQSQSGVVANLNIPGYQVRLGLSMVQTPGTIHKMQFDIKV